MINIDSVNHAIYQELLELEKKAHATGRKSYKRLLELQTKMLQSSLVAMQESSSTTQKSISQFDVLYDRYIQLEADFEKAVVANGELAEIAMPFQYRVEGNA
jgi:hypothetical protein